jgi:hypothetical protein
MTEQNTKTEKNLRTWNHKVVKAYQRAYIPLIQIASSLLGLWVIAYVLGWKRVDSYYDAMGSTWLVTELKHTDILAMSYWPILALIIGTLVSFSDLADRYMGKGMRNGAIFVFVILLLFEILK